MVIKAIYGVLELFQGSIIGVIRINEAALLDKFD